MWQETRAPGDAAALPAAPLCHPKSNYFDFHWLSFDAMFLALKMAKTRRMFCWYNWKYWDGDIC